MKKLVHKAYTPGYRAEALGTEDFNPLRSRDIHETREKSLFGT